MTHSQEPAADAALSIDDLRETWRLLPVEDRVSGFRAVPRADAEDFFLELPAKEQAELLLGLPAAERRSWLRLLPPDDAADLIQEADPAEREGLLALLDEATRREVMALLAYAEDEAGGLMNPRFARLRPDMTVDEAISYARRQAREGTANLRYLYVLNADQLILGVLSFRELIAAPADKTVREIMHTDIILAPDDLDQEELSRLFVRHGLAAIPVVDRVGHMKGIVTVDDIVDVVQEEATEDIQKIGGTQVLGAPYLRVRILDMVRKRGVWLMVLFIGEMLTATAMARYEHEIARAVVLSLFIPLIISSGGNSGSQATTLVISAMALGDIRLRDWWRVANRELVAGLALGGLLGSIGFARVMVWQAIFHSYGSHGLLLAITIFGSLVGVVAFGTLTGSMLPFILRRLGADPASASAPFVATLVDVTGIVIYFTVASLILRGTLL